MMMATVKKPNDWLRSQKMREQSDSALERMAENERELGLDYMEQTQTATYTCGVCGVSMQMEQPAQQEPVAYAVYHRMGGGKSLHWPEQHSDEGDHNEYHLVPLYTSPQPSPSQGDIKPWVGLTREDKKEIERVAVYVDGAIRLTEAKLREKNA